MPSSTLRRMTWRAAVASAPIRRADEVFRLLLDLNLAVAAGCGTADVPQHVEAGQRWSR